VRGRRFLVVWQGYHTWSYHHRPSALAPHTPGQLGRPASQRRRRRRRPASMAEDGAEQTATYEGERNAEGERSGTGTATFPSGDTYTGGYEQGRRQGRGVYTFAAGGKYEGEYEDGRRHGSGVMEYADGARYSGAWCCGLRHGEGVHTYASGDYYSGAWAAGAKHGQGVYFFRSSCSQFYGYWDCGVFVGGCWTHKDGTIYVGTFSAADVAGDGVFLLAQGNEQKVAGLLADAGSSSGWRKVGMPVASNKSGPRPDLATLLASLELPAPEPLAALQRLAPDLVPLLYGFHPTRASSPAYDVPVSPRDPGEESPRAGAPSAVERKVFAKMTANEVAMLQWGDEWYNASRAMTLALNAEAGAALPPTRAELAEEVRVCTWPVHISARCAWGELCACTTRQ
jgi:radial spoke head protein 1